MFTQFKLYVIGGVMAIVLVISGYMWIQNVRIDKLKSERDGFAQGWAQAKDANIENVKTIDELKKERERTSKSCEKRLADKNKLIDELRKIDETEGGTHEQAGTGTMDGTGGGNTDGGDALLALLNGMLPASDGGNTDGVCQAGSPSVSDGAALVSGDVLYCLDAVNAKNLAKDWALCNAARIEGLNIIEGLR